MRWGPDLLVPEEEASFFIKIKRNEAWAHCISKYSVSVLMHPKLHLHWNRETMPVTLLQHQQVQWIKLTLVLSAGQTAWDVWSQILVSWMCWLRCIYSGCAQLWSESSPYTAAQCKMRLKRGEVYFGFWGLSILFINFSRCSSCHFWEGKARFLHQHAQKSDWHIYDFSLQLF